MNLLGAVLILATCSVVLVARSRRWACLALIAGTLYVTQGQGITIGGFSIFSTRIFEIAATIRIIARRELAPSRWVRLDKLVLLSYLVPAVIYCLRTADQRAYAIGRCVDGILAYTIFRSLVTDLDDFLWLLGSLAVLLVPYAAIVLREHRTGLSPWFGMGGLDTAMTWTRHGVPRCEGSFRHPSLLGTLGASFLPLYIAMIQAKLKRRMAWAGIVACVTIVWEANSGGPVCFVGIVLVGWLLWRLRAKMYLIRRALVATLVLTAIVMKAPIWFIFDRMGDITGGDGWHRSELIDQAVRTIGHWWLWGMDISRTADWFAYQLGTGVADICDMYVALGLQAGVLAIALFVTMLVVAFKQVGRALAAAREDALGRPPGMECFLWGLGVMLAGHIFNWFAITYFDQTYVIWSLQLAALAALCQQAQSLPVQFTSSPNVAEPAVLQVS
ncbi:MAG: hypothetical protein ACREFX_11515 [Opitutaceae bacterium]